MRKSIPRVLSRSIIEKCEQVSIYWPSRSITLDFTIARFANFKWEDLLTIMLPPREIRSLKLKSWHYSLELKNRILFSRNFPQFFAIEGSKVEEVKSLKEDIEIPLQIYCENEVETWKRVPRQRRSFATDFFRSWRISFFLLPFSPLGNRSRNGASCCFDTPTFSLCCDTFRGSAMRWSDEIVRFVRWSSLAKKIVINNPMTP